MALQQSTLNIPTAGSTWKVDFGTLTAATVAGAITAGGCLGILIPPSVLLIVYGAVAGVSVVQLYAGAFLPGFMLAGLYIGYIIVLAKLRPDLMPPLKESERRVELPDEVLTTTLIHHQHYFPVVDEEGKLKPAFLAVTNTQAEKPETIARMGELANITMVKEATGSMDQASQIMALSNLTVLSGDDSLTLPEPLRAMTTATWPLLPCVIQDLAPFKTQCSPSRTAVVRSDARSEPASGSL